MPPNSSKAEYISLLQTEWSGDSRHRTLGSAIKPRGPQPRVFGVTIRGERRPGKHRLLTVPRHQDHPPRAERHRRPAPAGGPHADLRRDRGADLRGDERRARGVGVRHAVHVQVPGRHRVAADPQGAQVRAYLAPRRGRSFAVEGADGAGVVQRRHRARDARGGDAAPARSRRAPQRAREESTWRPSSITSRATLGRRAGRSSTRPSGGHTPSSTSSRAGPRPRARGRARRSGRPVRAQRGEPPGRAARLCPRRRHRGARPTDDDRRAGRRAGRAPGRARGPAPSAASRSAPRT